MADALNFHGFQLDQNEHQLEPVDRVTATYMVTNNSDYTVLSSVEITHADRTDVHGNVTLKCVPSIVTIPGLIAPNESRQVSIELVTQGELPGRHALRVQATYDCQPLEPKIDGLLEFTVAAD